MVLLEQARVGQTVRIERITHAETELLALRLGLISGERMLVTNKVPGGPLVVRRGQVDVALGRELCRHVEVSVVDEEIPGLERQPELETET